MKNNFRLMTVFFSRPSYVAELLITLIEDESKNGTAQQISAKGVKQIEFQEYDG